jgi:hypothetical protein
VPRCSRWTERGNVRARSATSSHNDLSTCRTCSVGLPQSVETSARQLPALLSEGIDGVHLLRFTDALEHLDLGPVRNPCLQAPHHIGFQRLYPRLTVKGRILTLDKRNQ